MPHDLISDMHEWMNKSPNVPTYYPAKPQPREQALQNHQGKKTLLGLTLFWNNEETQEVYNKWEVLVQTHTHTHTHTPPTHPYPEGAG